MDGFLPTTVGDVPVHYVKQPEDVSISQGAARLWSDESSMSSG